MREPDAVVRIDRSGNTAGQETLKRCQKACKFNATAESFCRERPVRGDQCRNWKHYQSLRINELLGHKGRLWQPESFDHLVRDGDHFQKFRKYIRNNPVKAGLKESEFRLYLPDLRDAHFVTD